MLGPIERFLQYIHPHRAHIGRGTFDTSNEGKVKPLPYELKELHTPKNAIVEYDPTRSQSVSSMKLTNDLCVSIIFVHELTGNVYRSWTGETAKLPWPKELLPPSLLPSGTDPARIFSFGYNIEAVDFKSMLSVSQVNEHAKAMLRDVIFRREEDNTVCIPQTASPNYMLT